MSADSTPGVPWGDEQLPFEKDAIREYLDTCIRHHRESEDPAAHIRVDVFQSVRTSIFGETLPEDPPPDDFDYGERRSDGQYENHPTVDEGEFVRPVRSRYKHVDGDCDGKVTRIANDIAESFARNPDGYSKTFCVGCSDYFPLDEFEWVKDGEEVGT